MDKQPVYFSPPFDPTGRPLKTEILRAPSGFPQRYLDPMAPSLGLDIEEMRPFMKSMANSYEYYENLRAKAKLKKNQRRRRAAKARRK